jgi:hypothetical protein
VFLSQLGGTPACNKSAFSCSITKGCCNKKSINSPLSLAFKISLKVSDIFFGHWSTLSNTTQPHVYPMDKGCAWGGALNMIRFKDKQIFSVAC